VSPRLPEINDKNRGERMRQAILDALKREARAGHAMTVREIGEAVNLHSSSTVHAHLQVLRRQGKIKSSNLHARSIEVVRTPEEICPTCGGSGWTVPMSPTFPIKVTVREYTMSGELLNDEIELVRKSRRSFDPHKYYRIRDSVMGREVLGEVPGTELIGDQRPPEETSFGH
jgi:hypothetical protein